MPGATGPRVNSQTPFSPFFKRPRLRAPGMSPALRPTAVALGAWMRKATPWSAFTSGETTTGPLGPLGWAGARPVSTSAATRAAAVRRRWITMNVLAGSGHRAVAIRLSRASSVSTSPGRRAPRRRFRTGSPAFQSRRKQARPAAVRVTVRARPSVGCGVRATSRRSSRSMSMARTVFGSDPVRRARSRWVIASDPARAASRTNWSAVTPCRANRASAQRCMVR